MSSSSSRGEPLLSASEEPYHLAGVQQGKKSFGWPQVCTSLCLGIAIGAGIGYHAFRTAQQETAPAVVVHEEQIVKSKLSNLPDPCAGWESRCHAGAAAAKKQGMGVFWPAAQCDDVLPPHGQTAGKTSCANRASTWSSGSIAQRPSPAGELSASVVADPLKHDTLFVFLPGTGTSPVAVRSLLDAAADMGCHVLALSYASLPVAVSQMNLWCTRDGADPALCNIELHEAVLFGASTTKKGASGLWEVSANQSVAYLLEAALRELQWGQFLNGSAGVRWDRIVVAGHSQGASHAAYLSTRKPLRGAVLFSGPQEVPECSSGWIGDAAAMPMLRRAVYSLKEVRARAATSSTAPPPPPPTTIPKQCVLQPLRKRSDAHIRRMFVQPPLSTRSQECGDAPALNASYCSRFPRLLSRNLEAMGLTRGDVGATSGYVVSDYEPLVADGRSHHNSVALKSAAPPPVTALWKALLGRLDAADAAE